MTAVAADGDGGNGVVAAVIDDNYDVMALVVMVSLTDSGSGNVGCCCQLCTSGS